VVRAVHGDAQQAPDPGVGAVGGDHVGGADGPLLAGRLPPQHDADAAGGLVEGDQLGGEADLGQAEALQVAEQDRLQVVLGHGGEAGRAGPRDPAG
jgi:hypothetical protein